MTNKSANIHLSKVMMRKFIFLVQDKKTACFQYDANGSWVRQLIKGEFVVDIDDNDFLPVLYELSQLLNEACDLQGVDIQIAYAEADASIKESAQSALQNLQCDTLKIEPLESGLELAKKTSRKLPKYPLLDVSNDEYLLKTLLPVLDALPIEESPPEEEVQCDNPDILREKLSTSQEEVKQLKVQISLLQAQLAQKQAQISATRLPDMAQLLVYLPAIYRNFWGVVRPDELALLAGTLNVPEVASPYADPSPDTVLVLRRRLLALPESERDCVIALCRELPHRLEVRMEMRDLLGAD